MRIGDPEQCGCVSCRNFVAARHFAYPQAILELYSRLGIMADREAETYEAGPGSEIDHRRRLDSPIAPGALLGYAASLLFF